MGDPRSFRKKYATPAHMWQGTRIADEKKLVQDYGLKNRREIWRAAAEVRKVRSQVRELIGKSDEKADGKKRALLTRLIKLGVIAKDSTLEDVLALTIKDILERRIQTLVHRKGIANTAKDARQMILHGHIKFKESKHTVPSTFVLREDEERIAYVGPTRASPKPKPESVKPGKEDKEPKAKGGAK